MQSTLNPALIPMCKDARMIPVLTIANIAHAVPLARALVAGGLPLLEITLRTPQALDAIRQISLDVEGAETGAGTVLTAQHGDQAIAAGARFLVSPGSTAILLDAAETWSVPLLPGVATASETMFALQRGYRFLKFFPAEPAGGVAALKALAAPLADAQFCPTGGIGTHNFAAYLSCPNVVCVGGSWVVPQALIEAGQWSDITRLARAAATPG